MNVTRSLTPHGKPVHRPTCETCGGPLPLAITRLGQQATYRRRFCAPACRASRPTGRAAAHFTPLTRRTG